MSEIKSDERWTSPFSWFDHFCLMAKRDDPKTHPGWQKNAIVVIITLSAFTAPFASCILFPSFTILVEHFHTTQTKVALTTTVFLLGLAVAPLWWSTLSQEYGRRPVLVFSFLISTAAVIVCAATNSLPLITVFRLIEAVGCSSAQSVGAGVISDIYSPTERGSALGWFYLGTLIGPLVAPIIGGALQVWLGWRANLYFMAIFTLTTSILTMMCLPETLVKPSTPKSESPAWYRTIQRDIVAPLPKLKFLLVPSIALTIAYISICFASLYCFNTTLPYAYSAAPYNFSAIEIGLCYISNCLGYAIGSVVGGKLSDAKLRQYQATHNGEIRPIERIKTVWYGVGFVPAGLLIYGWLVENKVFWIAPLVGAFLFGLGLMLVTSTVMPFLVDIKPGMGASVVADLNFVRNILAAIGTVLSPIAATNIGFGWWMTALALLCSCSVAFLGIVVWRDAVERKTSKLEGTV
ncbi:Major facilitator superfamily domain general substrate transporter [Penicillium brevicompactum]|uniref:Major facilitator superfamily domain general substrate transporter n=1 Tax=Penicillium brevicompactum TaxID=5074 RepID=UPI0025414AFB|nr:Major facilitator superfamily domain general substrate transporter [Penicillium brevicompactum]KAJ5332975.1 Major facilitator superfamily domain general substrate transporter [Penicillium brevicompactum]